MSLINLVERLELVSRLRLCKHVVEDLTESRDSEDAAHLVSRRLVLVHLDGEPILDSNVDGELGVDQPLVFFELGSMVIDDGLHLVDLSVVLVN